MARCDSQLIRLLTLLCNSIILPHRPGRRCQPS